MHTWRELITAALVANNEGWEDVECVMLTEEQLEMSCDPRDDDEHHEGPQEAAYTKDYVYAVTFDFDYDLYHITPYLRNPPSSS